MITITVNGRERSLPCECNLEEALAQLGLGGKPVLVELNGEAMLRTEWATRKIQNGDILELLQIVAGG